MDEHGYPDEAELTRIAEWPLDDCIGLVVYVRSLWRYADSGFWYYDSDGYLNMATAGWSGNEELIGALKKNHVFWGLCWESSHRGGRHVFRVNCKIQ